MAEGTKKRTALVIAGHGSARNPDSAEPTRRLAADITGRGLFDIVHAAFVKQEPKLAHVLSQIDADEVVIVPNMACRGYITATVIPRDAGLSGALTLRTKADGNVQRIHLTDPIGIDARITDGILGEIRTLVQTESLSRDQTAVLLIGHGSEKSRESFNQTVALAEAVDASDMVSEVTVSFLEEPPAIPTWAERTEARAVIAVPFLIAAGLHGSDDIPAELGIKDARETLDQLNERGWAGPFAIGDRVLWYLSPVGNTPVITDIVIDRAKDALSDA